MSNRIFHINEDGSIHEGALDHDVQMIVENEIIYYLTKYDITPAESIASIRRVLKELENDNQGVSVTCPALQHINPNARHSITRDTRPDGRDYWTTQCAYCGEVPSCGNHDWEPTIEVINDLDEFTLTCRNCGHKEIVDESIFNAVEETDDNAF